MTTYADLLAGAAEQIRIGAGELRTDRFWSADEALDTIGDFHAVLDAVASHTRRLLWPAQIGRIGLASHRDGLPPTERAAIGLAAGIETVVGEARPHPSQLAPATTPWLHAALHLRAASDLVATHFRPDGSARTPDAGRTDAGAFDAALAQLGHLASSVLACEEPLALRALQASVSTSVITKHLPGLGHLADLARDLGRLDPAESDRAHLERLGQTWTHIRTDDPVTELGDRMHRLRQTSWRLGPAREETLAVLRDVATIGIAVHAHAAAFHGAHPITAGEPAAGAQGASALIVRGRAWQDLHRRLSTFITLTPPHATVRDDLVALRRLLPQLSPLDNHENTATLADPVVRRVGACLTGAVETMTDIADDGARAFARLANTGALRLNARDLPRDVVSADPQLVEARLRGAVVRPPGAVTDAANAAFDVARAHPLPTLASPATVGRMPTQVERDVAAIGHAPADL